MRKIVFLNLFCLLVATCVLYIIPPFNFDYEGKRYIYTSLPNPFDERGNKLNFVSSQITPEYQYTIKSVSTPGNIRDTNSLSAKDIKILEQRLQNYVGNNFEIRSNVYAEEVKYIVYLNKSLDQSTNLLTATNSDFEVQSAKFQSFNSSDPNAEPEYEKIDLKREDFGFAELIPTVNNDGTIRYDLRMPLSLLLGPDKIKLITDKVASQLKIIVATKDYQGYFNYNQQGIPTHLVLVGLSSRSEGVIVRAFLNTAPTNMAYELQETKFVDNSIRSYIVLGIIALFLVISFLVSYFKYKRISIHKALVLLGLITIYIASMKLLNQSVSLISVLFIAIPVIFAIFQMKNIYFIFLIGIIFILKLLGLLNGFDITSLGVFLITVFTFFIALTNYLKVENKYEIYS